MRRLVAGWGLIVLLGCSGLLGEVKRRELAEMSVALDTAKLAGPNREELARLLDAAWLAADEIGGLEVSGFKLELEDALDDGQLTDVELAALRVKGQRFVEPPGLSGEERSAALARKKALEEEIAATLSRRAPGPSRTAKFADWALPNELSGRASALGWRMVRCDQDELDGTTWASCRFEQGGSVAEVEVHEAERSEDAREAELEDRATGGSVARDGKWLMNVSVVDPEQAMALSRVVAPDGDDLVKVGGLAVEKRLGAAGWTLSQCSRHAERDATSVECLLQKAGIHGDFSFEILLAEPAEPLTREAYEGLVSASQGNATLDLRLVDGSASAKLLAALLSP